MGNDMMRGCNRCNRLHNEVRGCPDCGCPEYRIIVMENKDVHDATEREVETFDRDH